MGATTSPGHTCPGCEQGRKQPSRRELAKQYEDAGSGYAVGKKPRALRLRGRRPPPLTIAEILTWSDEHHRLTGRWPDVYSKTEALPLGETWSAIRSALYGGFRGLPGGTTIGKLMAEYRDYRGPLTIERILGWADDHHAKTGRWPVRASGACSGRKGKPGP